MSSSLVLAPIRTVSYVPFGSIAALTKAVESSIAKDRQKARDSEQRQHEEAKRNWLNHRQSLESAAGLAQSATVKNEAEPIKDEKKIVNRRFAMLPASGLIAFHSKKKNDYCLLVILFGGFFK